MPKCAETQTPNQKGTEGEGFDQAVSMVVTVQKKAPSPKKTEKELNYY